jgi:hypothetical protein
VIPESIDNYVLRRESIREPDGKWHASSLFSCDRQAVYRRTGTEPTNSRDARSKRTLYLGTLLHGVVQTALHEYAEIDAPLRTSVATEVPLNVPEWDFVSSADGLVILPDEKAFIIEYKTVSEYGWKKELPQQAHVGQVTSYGWALRNYGSPGNESNLPLAPLGDRLDRAVIVYINKGNLDVKECWIDLGPDTDGFVEGKLGHLSVLVKHDLLPLRLDTERGRRNWLCGYCEFATRCWETDPDEGHRG